MGLSPEFDAFVLPADQFTKKCARISTAFRDRLAEATYLSLTFKASFLNKELCIFPGTATQSQIQKRIAS